MTPVPHMTGAEFREHGRRMVDLIASYLETVDTRPVLSGVRPGEVCAEVPGEAPSRGEDFNKIIGDVERLILPGLTHWQSPNFFGFFPANGSYPAILGELLSAGLGVQGMLWATSPACTELETRVLDWLGRMIGLPEEFLSAPASGAGGVESARAQGGGVIHSTASEATLVALVAARARARRSHQREFATRPFEPVLYTSTQAHSSVMKAAMIAGLADDPNDRRAVRLIETDDQLAMRAEALESAIRTDLDAGFTPAFICATLGTTGTTAVDDLTMLGPIARRFGVWLHVDAAYLGSQFVCPEHRAALAGVEHADSFCYNPHKWLLTNFDCSCFWTRDARGLIDALSITPEYLRNEASASGRVIDYRDWQIPLGRRFRALKLWMVIRHYGVEGLRAYIREHLRIAGVFESLVRDDSRFEVAAKRTSALVCFRLRARDGEAPEATDARNRALLDRLNAGGRVYLTHTVIPACGKNPTPRLVLRMAIGATRTEERHVRAAWGVIQECGAAVDCAVC